MAVSEAVSSARGRRIGRGVALAALAWLAVLFAAARLARHQVHARLDLSEDRVHSTSPVAPAILGRLEDVLQVELYATERIDDAPWQLAKRRTVELLRGLERLAPERIDVVLSDPSTSARARLEAERYGIRPQLTASSRDASASIQAVHLGAVLRYRGREHVIELARPEYVEALFLEGVQELVRPRRPTLGFVAEATSRESWSGLRQFLGARFDLVDVAGLAEGLPVPAGLDALVLVRPRELHPRAVFELDRYLGDGGRVLAFLDRSDADLDTFALTTFATGLEAYLAALGVRQPHALLFERGSPGQVVLRGRNGEPVPQPYPPFARLGPDEFDADQPVTRRLEAAELLWVHPFELVDGPADVERAVLATSSADAYLLEPPEVLAFDAEWLRRTETELLARSEGARRPLVVALHGRWPSPFVDGPPPARDPLGGGARDVPVEGVPRERSADARLVLVADADVVGKRGFGGAGDGGAMTPLTAQNRRLVDALVAWLALEPELLALRTRRPADRRIRDFTAEELAEEGLSRVARSLARGTSGVAPPAEAAARARARRKEWIVTGVAFAGALLLVGALELLAWRRRRAPLLAREEAS